MIAFWVVAGIFSALAATVVLLRAARAAAQPEPADPTPVLYRRQLAEIADLAERGLIGEGERKGAEAEAGRRLLAAADAPAEAWSGAAVPRAPVFIGVVAAPVLALLLYLMVGSPGVEDQPFAGRLKQWMANPRSLTPQEMAAVITSVIKTRPADPEGYRVLALAEGESNNAPGAVRALRHAVRLAPDRADLWEMLGEAEVMQAGGEVGEDARQAFQRTLALNPTSEPARFHLARARIAAGDRAGGIAAWRALLADMPPDDPHRAGLESAIAEAEGTPSAQPQPPALSGDQMTAVRGMVAGLAQRLKAHPDDPQGWVRLVRAYAVLGQEAERDEALRQARARFGARPDVMSQLTQAAAAEPMR